MITALCSRSRMLLLSRIRSPINRHRPRPPLSRRKSWQPILLPAPLSTDSSRQQRLYSIQTGGSDRQPPKLPLNESRLEDLKLSLAALVTVCTAMAIGRPTVQCDSPEDRPELKLADTTNKLTPQEQEQEDKKRKAAREQETEKEKTKNNKKSSIPLPKIPFPSIDTVIDKFQQLGDKIGDEILGRVPTLVDYFAAVDGIRRELQLGDGSVYQSIVNNMKDTNKNPEIQLEAKVRQGNELCPQEKAFLQARRRKIKKAFAAFIGVKESEVHLDDIPVVALAGSGGGYRAMVSTLGFMTAAKKAGVFDCCSYIAGVSGSSWFLAQYYTLGQRSFSKTRDHIKRALELPFADYPSFLTTMLRNPGASQLILEGIVQKYDLNRVMTLVDLFGTALASRLMIHRSNDQDEDEEWVDPLDFKLSQQSRWTNYGDQPLPILTAVSHVLPTAKDEESAKADDAHYYQWFEFTPYEIGSEETAAWIPTWAFGRRFVEGKSIEFLPEANLALLLGTFGSAFTASLAHYYDEVKPLLSRVVASQLDSIIKDYQHNMSLIHPLSPSCFPNPIYKLPSPAPEAKSFTANKNLYLNDAGMDNNLPLYPLLRPGRNVDVILAFDSSADIASVPWFEKADEYAKRRGIQRWPPIAKTRAKQLEMQESGAPRKMAHVEVFAGVVDDSRDADRLPESSSHGSENKPDPEHPITLIYFPLIPNESFDKEFDPSTEEFCSTWNFVIQEEQVESLAGLAESNFRLGLGDIRHVLKETWRRKKKTRIEAERKKKRELRAAAPPAEPVDV